MHRDTAAKSNMIAEKYLFWRAIRPFSFSVALIVCLTGIVIAYRDGITNIPLSLLILSAGLLLQAGVNLINDYADLSQPELSPASIRQIKANFNYGLISFLLAAIIGFFLIIHSGPLLLVLTAIGVVGALGYTLEPINYKRRGLAVLLVFWLMGVLMVVGSYYALSSEITADLFLLSVPVSLFTSLLLLSNEIRDFEDDCANGINTLTVRLGYPTAVVLYRSLVVSVYLACLLLYLFNLLPGALWVLLSLPVLLLPLGRLEKTGADRSRLPPETGRSFLCFGLCYCLALLF